MAKRVYIVHAYSDHLSHVEKIIKLNPDLILLWSDIEYDVLYIFNRFISTITDYLQANNKTITILYPGPNKKLNDYVFLEKTYGYQLVLQESLISDINQRIEGIVENIKKLKTLDKNEVHSRLFDKLVYNKNQLCNYSQMKEKMVPKSLEFVFSEPYEFLGDAYATEKWLKYVSNNSWAA